MLRTLRRLWMAWWTHQQRSDFQTHVRPQLEQLESRDHPNDLLGASPFAALGAAALGNVLPTPPEAPVGRLAQRTTGEPLAGEPPGERPPLAVNFSAGVPPTTSEFTSPASTRTTIPQTTPSANELVPDLVAQLGLDALGDPGRRQRTANVGLGNGAPGTGGNPLGLDGQLATGRDVGAGFDDARQSTPALPFLGHPETDADRLLRLLNSNDAGTSPDSEATLPLNSANSSLLRRTDDEPRTLDLGEVRRGAQHATNLAYGNDLRLAPEEGDAAREKEELLRRYGDVPLFFEENRGQIADPNVRFLSRGPRGAAAFTDRGVAFTFQADNTGKTDHVELNFVGTNKGIRAEGRELLPTKVNYAVGDPSTWIKGIQAFQSLVYEDVYEGVDLVWHPSQFSAQKWQYDYVVKPGVDASALKLNVAGARQMRLGEDGTLRATLEHGELVARTPILYQVDAKGERELVQGGFRLDKDGSVGFNITGAYDRSRALVLDPTLEYSSLLGGYGDDWASAVAVNAAGEAVAVGRASPTWSTSATAFAARFNATGDQLLYLTHFGASGADVAEDVALTTAGEAVIVGRTESLTFGATAGAYQTTYQGGSGDAFVVRLGTDGNVGNKTFLGGLGSDAALSVAINGTGDVVVAGTTQSDDFPTTLLGDRDDSQEVFVAVLSPDLATLRWSTFLEPGTAQDDNVRAVAIGAGGAIYVGGDFGVAALSPDGATLLYQRSLDALGISLVEGLAVHAGSGAVYAVGAGQVAVLGADLQGNTTLSLTGTGATAEDVAVDGLGRLYVAGAAEGDAYVWAFAGTNTNGVWSYALDWWHGLGSGGDDQAKGLATNGDGTVYLVGRAGYSDFQTVNAAQGTFGGGTSDAFVARVSPQTATPAGAVTLTVSPNPSQVDEAVTMTVTVPGMGVPVTPTGYVTLYDGTAVLHTWYLNGSETGPLTFTTTTLGAGAHTFQAFYDGDVNHPSSQSVQVQHTVSPTGGSQAVPQVWWLSTDYGPTAGGTEVQVHGSNFTGATAVLFGTTPATSFTVHSDGHLTAVAPAHAAGPVDVTVSNAEGTSAPPMVSAR